MGKAIEQHCAREWASLKIAALGIAVYLVCVLPVVVFGLIIFPLALYGTPVLCGYLAAAVARRRHIYYGILIGITGPLAVVASIVFIIPFENDYGFSHFGTVLGWTLTSGLLGGIGGGIGWYRLKKTKSRQIVPESTPEHKEGGK